MNCICGPNPSTIHRGQVKAATCANGNLPPWLLDECKRLPRPYLCGIGMYRTWTSNSSIVYRGQVKAATCANGNLPPWLLDECKPLPRPYLCGIGMYRTWASNSSTIHRSHVVSRFSGYGLCNQSLNFTFRRCDALLHNRGGS